MKKWTRERLNSIKDIQQKCVEKEEYALAAYSLYVARMLNGLCQMGGSMFHEYEKNILCNAMQLFTSYYEEQVNVILNGDKVDTYKKQVLLADIEDSVFHVVNVYKNMVDGTSNSDRNLFSSLSVDSNIYELSPKVYKYYSEILEKIVKIFNAEKKYAFLLHPTIKSRIEVRRIFNEREDSGKVVLIFLPENKSNNINNIRMYLLHEAFHILPRGHRCLRLRTQYLFLNMCEGMRQLLFFNVNKIDELSKDKLMKEWFPFQSDIKEIKMWGEENRQHHSKEIIPYLHEKWKVYLYKIMDGLGESVAKGLAEKFEGEEYYQKIIKCEMQIRKNILKILGENRISQLLHQYMYLYKECLADACMVYTLPKLNANEYEAAFEETIPFDSIGKQEFHHMERTLRTYIVAKTVVKIHSNENLQDWNEYENDQKKKCLQGEDSNESLEENNNFNVVLKQCEIDRYIQYLLECLKNIKKETEKIDSKNKLEELQKMLEIKDVKDILVC